MGLFNFVTKLASASIKAALTPIAIVVDTVEVLKGTEPSETGKLLDSAMDDVNDATDEIT